MINNLQKLWQGPSTLEKIKVKQTGREKLKLEAAGDGASETAALVGPEHTTRSQIIIAIISEE